MPRPLDDLRSPAHVTYAILVGALWFGWNPLVTVAAAYCEQLTLACDGLGSGNALATNVLLGQSLLALSVLVLGVFSIRRAHTPVESLRKNPELGQANNPILGTIYIGGTAAVMLAGCAFIWWSVFVWAQGDILNRPLRYAAGAMACYIVGGVVVDHMCFIGSLFSRKLLK